MGRLTLIFLIGVAVLACAACGGGKQTAAGRSLPSPLVKQIQTEVLKQAVILGASSAKSIEVYGPASHVAIERASSPGSVGGTRVAGAWYLIVLRGNFAWNGPVPPGGATAPLPRTPAGPTGAPPLVSGRSAVGRSRRQRHRVGLQDPRRLDFVHPRPELLDRIGRHLGFGESTTIDDVRHVRWQPGRAIPQL